MVVVYPRSRPSVNRASWSSQPDPCPDPFRKHKSEGYSYIRDGQQKISCCSLSSHFEKARKCSAKATLDIALCYALFDLRHNFWLHNIGYCLWLRHLTSMVQVESIRFMYLHNPQCMLDGTRGILLVADKRRADQKACGRGPDGHKVCTAEDWLYCGTSARTIS